MFRSNRSRAILALLAASFVFGATFVVVKSAVVEVPPLTFVAWRFLLGALLLSIFAFPAGAGSGGTARWPGSLCSGVTPSKPPA